MHTSPSKQTAVVNLPTVIALGALVMSLNVALHEAAHAVAWSFVDGDPQIYNALAVDCCGRYTPTFWSAAYLFSLRFANIDLGPAMVGLTTSFLYSDRAQHRNRRRSSTTSAPGAGPLLLLARR